MNEGGRMIQGNVFRSYVHKRMVKGNISIGYSTGSPCDDATGCCTEPIKRVSREKTVCVPGLNLKTRKKQY